MRFWICETAEPIPVLDGGFRELRAGMLSRAMAAAGHDVLWWDSTFCHMKKSHRFKGPVTVRTGERISMRLIHGPGYGKNRSPMRFLHQKIIARSFAAEASKVGERPDLVFACLPTPEMAEEAVKYGKKHGVPVVVDIRDIWPDLYLAMVPAPLAGVARLALSAEFARIRRTLRGATALTAVSGSYLEWGLKNAERELNAGDGVFYLGYPEPRIIPDAEVQKIRRAVADRCGLAGDEVLITFVGTLNTSYDLSTVVEAARMMNGSEFDKVRFLIVGDGDQGPQLRQRARGLKKVVFAGWFDQTSISTVLKMSVAGLAPYRAGATQSLPNKPFEYIAAGTPIISCLPGEMADLIKAENLGFQYTAGDPSGLIGAVERIIRDRGEAARMGENAGRLFRERFSETVVYPRFVEHLEKLVVGSNIG